MECRSDDLKQARQHLRDAAEVVKEKLVGGEILGHLRQATRHILQASITAIDEAEQRRQARHTPPPASTN